MKRARIAAVAVAGILGLTAVGCSSGPSDSGGGGGDLDGLTIAVPLEPANFDPVISTAVPTTEPIRNVLETLLTQSADGTPTPLLAESYEQAEDNMSVSFTLRTDVNFHDGSVMDADDVVASMNRWIEHSTAAQASFPGATMEKVSDTEVVLQLAEPNSAADLVLAYADSSIPYITTQEAAEAAGENPIDDLIGTGPFEFVSWDKGQKLELKRFEDYSAVESAPDGLAGDRTAAFDTLTYEFTPDASTMVAGLQSGRYDIATSIPFDNYDQLASSGNLSLETTDATNLPNLYFNKAEGLFSDVKAREALKVGLNLDELLFGTYGNEEFYEPANGCMMPVSLEQQWPCDDSNAPGEPDPEQAKQLLAEAGYNGETVRVITSRDSGAAYPLSTILQQQLEALGMNVSLETYDYATLRDKRAEPGSWELIVINNIAKVEPLQQFYVPSNNPGWTDEETLAPILRDYQSAGSVDERQAVYIGDMQEWFDTYIPIVNIGSASDLFAVQGNIDGIGTIGSTIIVWTATGK